MNWANWTGCNALNSFAPAEIFADVAGATELTTSIIPNALNHKDIGLARD